MTADIDNGGELKICEPVYADLLSRRLPRAIASADQHAQALSDVAELMALGSERSPEQTELLKLLVILIGEYESKKSRARATPVELLQHLMEEHGHTAKDLWPVVGDRAAVSRILSGEREISKAAAKRLAAFYSVSVALFI